MISKMKTAVLIASLALTGCASVGQPLAGKQDLKRYELNDGSVLIVDANGQMRMFNVYGNPLYMKDGVAMELKDGTIVTMKENMIWKQLRNRGTLSPRT
jgi:hypothetical protein